METEELFLRMYQQISLFLPKKKNSQMNSLYIAKVNRKMKPYAKIDSETHHFFQWFSINGLHNVKTAPKFRVELMLLSFAHAL
jgi:hypothetical protein